MSNATQKKKSKKKGLVKKRKWGIPTYWTAPLKKVTKADIEAAKRGPLTGPSEVYHVKALGVKKTPIKTISHIQKHGLLPTLLIAILAIWSP